MLFYRHGCFEKRLTHYSKELCRTLGCVRIDNDLLIRIHADAETCISLTEGVAPRVPAHIPMQRRKSIGIAIEHVEFVSELMYYHVISHPCFRSGSILP